jgi:hypothetical protein
MITPAQAEYNKKMEASAKYSGEMGAQKFGWNSLLGALSGQGAQPYTGPEQLGVPANAGAGAGVTPPKTQAVAPAYIGPGISINPAEVGAKPGATTQPKGATPTREDIIAGGEYYGGRPAMFSESDANGFQVIYWIDQYGNVAHGTVNTTTGEWGQKDWPYAKKGGTGEWLPQTPYATRSVREEYPGHVGVSQPGYEHYQPKKKRGYYPYPEPPISVTNPWQTWYRNLVNWTYTPGT